MLLKIICALIISLCYVSASPTPLDDGIAHIKISADHIHGTILNERLRMPQIYDHHIRSKRQTQWSTDDAEIDESALCILQCANQLKAASARFGTDEQFGSTTNANKMLKPNLNLARFNELCSAMRPPLRCFDQCPSSPLKSSLKESLEPIRFLCVDRFQDFQRNLPCMHKLEPTAFAQCKPRCRRFEAAMNKTAELGQKPYLRYLYTPSQLIDMISGTCQYVQCYMECSGPLTRSVCGNTAAELISGVIQKMFAAVQNHEKLSGVSVLPESCKRLARPNITDRQIETRQPEVEINDDLPANSNRDINPWQDQDEQGSRINTGSNNGPSLYIDPAAEDDSIEE